jgi:periplasmic protein TonB
LKSTAFYRWLTNPKNRVLAWALGFSLLLHVALLSLKIAAPETFDRIMGQTPLEVVLVNAKSATLPQQPQALAQVNLEGGGDADKGMATSPLPDSGRVADGDSLQELKKRVEELEAEQTRLFAEVKANDTIRAALEEARDPNKTAQNQDTNAEALARKAAAIEKQIQEYNKRPRRKEISPSTREVEYATYYAAWRDKVEKIGTENYPAEARGKLYGDLIVTVSIWSDGRIENITVHRSSGVAVLDKAALRIFKLAAPYGQFSPEMRAKYQIFDITTRFIFAKGELEVRPVQ